MSGQTVTGLGLQFTDDNKHAYAYSGVVVDAASASAAVTALLFTTQSEYLETKLSVTNDELGGAQTYLEIYLNDIRIIRSVSDSSSSADAYVDNPFHLLIPPFSKIEVKVGASATMDFTAWVTAKVGMAPRVGN